MAEREFSATRSRASWKPRVDEGDLPLFSCPDCRQTAIGVSGGGEAVLSGEGRPQAVRLPYRESVAPRCGRCGAVMEPVALVDAGDVPEGVKLDFQFRGGFNANCVKVKWSFPAGSPYSLEWVALKTFTGMQLKYATPGKRSPLTFAFADEDAYCYCDSDPCEECMFRCKFGMAAYVAVRGIGVVRTGFDRMLASGAGASNQGLRRSNV